MRVFIPRFLGAIAYLVVLTVVGTVGYVTIEGWPWQEAHYMTVITVTAVGFREVQPLSGLGQDFTMGLLAAGRPCRPVRRWANGSEVMEELAPLPTGRANPPRCAHPSGNGADRHPGAETDRPDT